MSRYNWRLEDVGGRRAGNVVGLESDGNDG